MIRVENLEKSFGGQTLFSHVSFQLGKGERCAFVGRNGSGKSTLFRILIGDESPDKGEVFLPNHYKLGYLRQQIKFTQNTVLLEASQALPESERETPYRVESILFGLGFSEKDLSKDPNEFSGGFQLRIELAKTLVQEPDCLLLDEPTNYLDVVATRWLIRFLKSWKGEMFLISHDRIFLEAVTTHTMGLHRGELFHLEEKVSGFFDYILQMEEIQEKSRQKIEKKREHAEAFIRRFGAKATKAKQAQSRLKQIQKLPSLEKLAAIDGLSFHFNYAPFSSKQMMRIENVSFRYPQMDNNLINHLTLEIEPGDRVAIIGKNGRGKSTILKLLSGELTQGDGKIFRAEKLKIGYFGQTNIQALNPELTIEEEISRANIDLSLGEVRGVCGMMMFSQDTAEKKIGVLSGGEKSRVLLGKIIASSCNLLLLDEPSNHLDIESVEAFLEALEVFEGSVVVVSHCEELLSRLPDKLIVCHEGRQELFLGGYDYFLEKIGWNDGLVGDSARDDERRKNSEKEERRKKAEIVQQRAKILAPIKRNIEKIELKLGQMESKSSVLHSRLEEAVLLKDNEKIAGLSKEIGLLQKEIDVYYAELEKEYIRFDEVD